LIAVLQRRDATALLYPRRMATIPGDAVHVRNRKLDSRSVMSLRRQDAGDVSVSMPVGSDQCWNAALPCTPELTSDKIRLRDPARGFSAGFKK
jgi:hypothetical protein